MNVVGTSYPIHDAREKACGEAVYAGDIKLKQMAFVGVVYSTVAHGNVLSMDFSAADALPGVLGHLSCLEPCGNLYNRYRSAKGQNTPAQEYVFNRHVRFVGDRIGCMVARDSETARRAAKLVKVRYEEYPAAFTPAESLSGTLAGIHPQGNVSEEVCVEEGIMPQGDFVSVKTHTDIARISHVAMEPHACTVDYKPQTGQLTIWSPCQSVFAIRTVIGDIFDLPYSKVRVIKATMGGSFGCKQEWVTEPVAVAAALAFRRPIQYVMTREEVFRSSISRAPMSLDAEGIYGKNGKLVSFRLDNTLDAGAYLGNSKDYCGAMANKFFRCYHYPHMKYTGRAVITNSPVSGAFRGWTSPEMALCLEHNLNMAARRLQIDPLALRLLSVAHPGDIDVRIQEPLGPIRIQQCLEEGREAFAWAEKREADKAFNAAGGRYRRGCAVACGGHLNGYYPRVNDFTEVGLRMTEVGDVIANITVHDHGCGSVQVMKMILAEALTLSPDLVQVTEGDTGVTPFDVGCFSSRTTYVIGHAAQECAGLLLAQLKKNASALFDVPAERLTAANGCLCDAVSGRQWPFAEVVQLTHTKLQQTVSAVYKYRNTTNPGVAGAHFAHVEVDTLLGNVRILEYLAVHDIGRAINPEICRAQVQGAVAMGAGAALTEEMTLNKRGEAIHSLSKYHVLNAPELPLIQVRFIEDGGTNGAYECKSIGEVCHVPVAAAIVGAVNEALDTDLCHIPLNQDRIRIAWAEKEGTV